MPTLTLWIGRANTGKSRKVLHAIQTLGDSSQQLLLVPEHASHEAERDLCRYCGAAASRHAEVVSPRLLANRALALTEGSQDGTLDAGGKLLLMQAALAEVLPALTVYARPSRRAPFLTELVGICGEFQACRIAPEDLAEASRSLEGLCQEKTRDLSLIYAAYENRLTREGVDRRDWMEKLLDKLEESGYAAGKDIFVDGYSYFNAQEEQLLAILLRTARSVTVTLLGDRDNTLDVFRQGQRARDRLVRLAQRQGAVCDITYLPPAPAVNALTCLETRFFDGGAPWNGSPEGVSLHQAEGLCDEVEFAASRILDLARRHGVRFRDIAVTARNMEEYAPILESVFPRYGIPFYLSRRSDMLEKPVLCLIAGTLDAVSGGYEYEDMFRFLKTGLAGLSGQECDRLENYVLTWDIHGAMWIRDDPWTANPAGWKEEFTPEETARLEDINALRKRVAEPLRRLAEGLTAEKTARGKLKTLWQYLEEVNLPGQLEERTQALEEAGDLQTAQEYGQIWELLCGVMDQFADALGDLAMNREEFSRLFQLVLTQYDIGTIPVSLDQVQVSQIDRNDRHTCRCLFLLGANDHVLPAVPEDTGLLNREDRAALLERGLELAPWGAELLEREMQNLYAALAKPQEQLFVSWPISNGDGTVLRPSFVVGRIRNLIPGVEETAEDGQRLCRLSAPLPALEMAGERPNGTLWNYFAGNPRYGNALRGMERAAHAQRGRLSEQAVETLYGKSYRMSASRVEKVSACHFAYFMEYGLKAKERAPARFDALQIGTFLHYVLEHTTKQAMARGGFGALEKNELRKIIRAVIDNYVRTALPQFHKRDKRFQYLFRRLENSVTAIVENVAEELQASDFTPVAFELEFGEKGGIPAITLESGGASLTVGGKVDRVDGWLKDGKLYLRVVDYKSGKKAFDLSDVRYGLNIQMLLYLFALQRQGEAWFGGRELIPAGVLYLPARDVLINAPRDIDETALRKAVDKELRRSGLVLNQPDVLRAMEHSALEEPRFLPLTLGRDGSITKGLATAEELGKLGKYVDALLQHILQELHGGNVDADPCGHGSDDNACTYCAFASACGYREDIDHMTIIRPISPDEFWRQVDEAIENDSGKNEKNKENKKNGKDKKEGKEGAV